MRPTRRDWDLFPEVVDGVLSVNIKTKVDAFCFPVSVALSTDLIVQRTDVFIVLVPGSGA